MTAVAIKPEDLAKTMRQRYKADIKAMIMATRAASMKLKTHLVQKTKDADAVDQGIFKNSFKVVKFGNVWGVLNDAPHAGIVEGGARPHAVSREGILAIAAWVRRKLRRSGPVQMVQTKSGGTRRKDSLKYSKDEALQIAYMIAQKIKKFGVKGRFIVRDAEPMAQQFFDEELRRILREQGIKASNRHLGVRTSWKTTSSK